MDGKDWRKGEEGGEGKEKVRLGLGGERESQSGCGRWMDGCITKLVTDCLPVCTIHCTVHSGPPISFPFRFIV